MYVYDNSVKSVFFAVIFFVFLATPSIVMGDEACGFVPGEQCVVPEGCGAGGAGTPPCPIGKVCCKSTHVTDVQTPYPLPTQISCEGKNPLLIPSCALKEVPKLTIYVVNMTIIAGGVAGLLSLLYGGFLYITAGDETNKAEKGRKTVMWSFLGLVVAASLYTVMSFVTNLLNIPGFSIVPIAYAVEEPAETFQVYGTIRDSLDTVLPGSSVTLYEKMGETWKLWDGKAFGNQRNPFVSDVFGHYQFFTQAGTYYVMVAKDGFHGQQSASFEVVNAPVKQNVMLDSAASIWVLIVTFGGILFVGSLAYITIVTFARWRKREALKRYAQGKITGSALKIETDTHD